MSVYSYLTCHKKRKILIFSGKDWVMCDYNFLLYIFPYYPNTTNRYALFLSSEKNVKHILWVIT